MGEVLSADAYSRFEEEGVLSPVAVTPSAKEVLGRGGSRDAMTNFVAFRGRSPTVDALCGTMAWSACIRRRPARCRVPGTCNRAIQSHSIRQTGRTLELLQMNRLNLFRPFSAALIGTVALAGSPRRSRCTAGLTPMAVAVFRPTAAS